jgi:hypothetical protein
VGNVSDKRYREEAGVLFFKYFLNYAVYEMMWKNDTEPDRPPMTI